MIDFFAQSYPPKNAEDVLHGAILEDQRKLGRISASGKAQTLVMELEDIDPSALRLMWFLYNNDEVTIDRKGVQACKSPNLTQMKVDLRWLIDQQLVEAVIHEGKQYTFLTPRGEGIIDNG